jgi:hypothetical protein
MSESKTNIVAFDGVTFLASRPEVLAGLERVSADENSWVLTFRGTEAELVAAGLATAAMFQGLSKEGNTRTQPDEYSNDVTVTRRRHGWKLRLIVRSDGPYAGPTDEKPGKCKWWIKHGREARAATAEILKRFAQPAVPQAPRRAATRL